MPQYFIKVSTEYQLLDMFLKKCDPFNEIVIIEIDSQSPEVPRVVVTCDAYPWVRRRYSHVHGYTAQLPGYQTIDLSLLASSDSSNIWVSKVFGKSKPSLVVNPLRLLGPYTNPEEIPFSPRDPLIDSPP